MRGTTKKAELAALLLIASVSSVQLYMSITYGEASSQSIPSHGIIQSLPPSYTIYKSGSTFYVKDQGGTIRSSSSSATAVIQYAIDNTDGLILIEDGIYPVGTIVPDDKTHILGQSWNTILVRSGSASVFRWNPSPSDYLDDCVFENFQIDGKKTGAGGWIHGFFLWNVRNIQFKNLYIHHMPACGMEIKGQGKYGFTTQNVVLSSCKFEDCGEEKSTYYPHSVYFNGQTNGVLIENCESYRCYGAGFQFRGATEWMKNIKVRNCVSVESGEPSDGFIFIDGIDGLEVTGCKAYKNKRHGFSFWNGAESKPIYRVILDNCEASGNTYSAVKFQGSSAGPMEYLTISNNKFRNGGSSKDILLNEYCNHFKIVYNEGSLSYPTAGKDYEVHDNYG